METGNVLCRPTILLHTHYVLMLIMINKNITNNLINVFIFLYIHLFIYLFIYLLTNFFV